MSQIAKVSGGKSFWPHNSEGMDEAFEQIALDLRRQYSIGYLPANFVADGVPQMVHHGNAASELLTNRKTSSTDSRPRLDTVLPIVTANGFTLLEGSRLGGTTEHRFRVRHSTGTQHNISVRFDRSLMARVDQVRRSHLWIGSRFWTFRAEAYLEAYLIEKADFPPYDQLLIEELSDDEMLLAAHWQD